MRNLVLTLCLGALLGSVVGLPTLAAKDLSKIQATLDSMSEELVRATLAGDVDTVMSYYTEDSVSMPNYHGILKGLRNTFDPLTIPSAVVLLHEPVQNRYRLAAPIV